MADYFTGNALWYLVQQSDPVSKGILLILGALSLLSWIVFLSKLLLFYIHRRSIRVVQQNLGLVRSLNDVAVLANRSAGTIAGQLLFQTLLTIESFSKAGRGHVTADWEVIQYHIDQAVDQLIVGEESYLSMLSTSAAVSPLLGLFGTVWGLVHAFIRISEKQAADITVVAPGIAEALLTTLAGLMVAIPALVMYNYLVMRARHMEHRIIQIADQLTLTLRAFLTGS